MYFLFKRIGTANKPSTIPQQAIDTVQGGRTVERSSDTTEM